MKPLENKIAIVTGAGHPRGIGRSIAVKLAEQGASVVVTDLASAEAGLQQVVAELQELGVASLAIPVDITRVDQVEACVKQVLERFCRIDILANNAGVGLGSGDFLENTDNDWDITLNVNVKGLVNVCKTVLPVMVKQQSGNIVNTASLCGLRNIPPTPAPYTASKHAVIGITKAIAQEFGKDNIRCNAVCPGSIDTAMRETVMDNIAKQFNISMEEAEAEENATISLGRPAQPDEVGAVVAFLAGPHAGYVTGAALPVDGGMTFGL